MKSSQAESHPPHDDLSVAAPEAHLRTLPLCHVTARDFLSTRPACWLRGAGAAGWPLPLGLARDLGMLLTQPSDRLTIARPHCLPFDDDCSAYAAFLERFASHSLVRELPSWSPPLSDAVLSVVLARLVEGVELPECYRPPTGPRGVLFSRILEARLAEADVERIRRETPPEGQPSWRELLTPRRMALIESNLRTLEREELRFLVRYGAPLGGSPDPRDLLDLLALTRLPSAARLALSQTIKLLPRLSETSTVGGVQTYPEGGYEGLARKGSLDSLLLTEPAYPDDIFLHRFFNHEALYYGRERPKERRRELAYVVMQMGYGLGGDGQILARALLLALAQAMRKRGYEVLYSFAGSTLTEPRSPDKPGEVARALYAWEPALVDVGQTLRSVWNHLCRWREMYRGRQVLWVLSEHFDADDAQEHEPLYRALRAEAGQQAWWVRTGKTEKVPVAARYFDHSRILDSELIWEGRSLPPSHPLLPKPPKADWEQWKDIIEGHPFLDGIRDALHFTHQEQRSAWNKLARMENRLPVDTCLRALAPEGMVYIPPGPFLMGCTDEEIDEALSDYKAAGGDSKYTLPAIESARGQFQMKLTGYYIDHAPVTVAQYRRFMEAGGYEEETWWTEAKDAGRWEDGNYKDYYGGKNRRQPEYWDNEKFNGDDQPVVGVTWYEALAYARWAGKALPTEAQWEKAAAWDPVSGQRRKYPWGNEWDPDRCNAVGHDRTTPVGRFSPQGDSPYGLVDMAGNVYEWCSTRWGTKIDRPDYSYPYREDDGREDLGEGDGILRIVRGGSWATARYAKTFVRCGFRHWGSIRGTGSTAGDFVVSSPTPFLNPEF